MKQYCVNMVKRVFSRIFSTLILFLGLFSFNAPIMAAENSSVIFVGDSRTVQMQNYLGTADTYVCKGSMGYSWFMSTALPQVNAVKNPGDIIVFNFGVNDMYQVQNYIATLNQLVETDWADCTVYYMSVNPVNDAKTSSYGGVSNAGISSFNQTAIQGLSDKIRWIDTYSASVGMINTDASKSDAMGVHYSADVYRLYYDMVQEQIESDRREEEEKLQREMMEEIADTVAQNVQEEVKETMGQLVFVNPGVCSFD